MVLTVIILIIMAVCAVIVVGIPAWQDATDSLKVKNQRTGEQIKVYDMGFAERRKQLALYVQICAALAVVAGILLIMDASLFFQEASKEYFSADQNKQTNLFMGGVALTIIFLSLVHGLNVLRTKKKALSSLESERARPEVTE